MENQANDLNLKPTKSQLFQRKASHDSGINRSPMSNKIIINLNTLLSNDKTLFSKAFPIRTPSKPEIRTPDSLTFYNYKFKDFIPPMSTVNVKKLINEEKNEQTTNSKSLLNKLKLLNQRPSISQQKRRKSLATNQIIKTNISNIETNTDITNHRKTFSMIGGVSPNKNGQKSKFIEMKKGVFHKNKGNNIKANKSVASNCSSINASIGMKKIEDKEKINKISDKINKAIYSKNIIEDNVLENIQEVFDILKTDSESKNLIDRFEKYLNKIYNEFYSKLITQNNQIETYMSDNSKLKSDIKDLNHQIHSLKTELINNQNSNSTAYTTLEKKSKNKKKNSESFILKEENEKLKDALTEMQDNINVLQNKEKQIKKIIKIFKKKGVNINEILLNASDSSQSEGSEELYDESYKLSRLKAPLIEEDLQIKEEYADESIINDSEESSFNFYGKEDNININEISEGKHNKKSNKKPKKIPETLKLNLNIIKNKNIGMISSNNSDNINQNAKILQKKFSEQPKSNVYNWNEDFLKKIDELGLNWKKMQMKKK